LKIHPSYSSARVVLGRIYQEQGKKDRAVLELEKVLEIDSENIMAFSLLASLHMAGKDYQAAIGEYQKILSLNPEDEAAQSFLKEAIEKVAGKGEPLKVPLRSAPPAEAKPAPKESTATLTIAELYLNQGHTGKSIEVFQELLAHDPQNLILRQKLSEVIERQMREAATGGGPGLKTNEFTRPPEPQEEAMVEPPVGTPASPPVKKGESKFTRDEIFQAMGRAGADEVPAEKSKPKAEEKQGLPSPGEHPSGAAPEALLSPFPRESLEEFKKILADLSVLDGVRRVLLVGGDGITVVSMGETGNNAVLGRQALDIFKSTDGSLSRLNQGHLQHTLVTADAGSVFIVSAGGPLLVVSAESKVNLGILRMALDSAAKKISKVP
jgi:predicted regulator of Ras-like GTPase activity (Roadblock/LC7/MglB family)